MVTGISGPGVRILGCHDSLIFISNFITSFGSNFSITTMVIITIQSWISAKGFFFSGFGQKWNYVLDWQG